MKRSGANTNRDVLSAVNPVIAFIFFAFALIMPMLLLHPVLLGISFCTGTVWLFCLRGRKALGLLLKFVLPVMLLTAILNPLFNHEGVTILFYLRDNPVTLESILYGCASAAMLGSVVIWFACFNAIFTADKIVYLTGRLAPSLSLVIAMALRFVPLFTAQAKRISLAQRGAGMSTSGGNIIKRAKNGLSILSGLITWALESSVTTADSMRARGYGLHPRRSFANYRFDGRDAAVGIALAVGILLSGLAAGFRIFSVRFFPSYRMNALTPLFFLACAAYALTLLLPTILNIEEALKWRSLRSEV
ncbi:MAG: energy-coupling factor transporter transmembrane protein EcfT [Clostridia bacterium]|nr:energy-coupling factor transporter transmembrane protein EcfT [Clostridia bacterium]MBR6006255.1 energy-coupling factor transporter transmembrane protein EcfT [Clostridia bacterium]